jgi:hypothetical protein
MWKRLICALALLTGLAFGQIDISTNQVGPYITLTRNATWTGSGPGAINNAFIFTPLTPDSGMCFYVQNNDSGTHGLQIAVYETGDPQIPGYESAAGAQWIYVGQASVVLNGLTAGNIFVKASGAARIAAVASSGTGAGTATINLVQTQQNCGLRAGVPLYCNVGAGAAGAGNISQVVTTATTAQLIVGQTGLGVHVCWYSVSIGGTPTTSTGKLIYGTGGTCGTSTLTAISFTNGTVPFNQALSGGGNELFPDLAVVGDSLCYTDGGSGTGTTINLSYVQF